MLEVDPTLLGAPDDEDYDSAGYDTSTASLSSSVHQYLFEHGRRYHTYYGPEKYLIPTDEKEQDRLDLHHEIMRMLWDDRLHECPLHQPHQILDIDTGTGIWAIEMADQYPMAEIIGTHLSPIQPEWVPANCRFEVDDAMSEWTFKDDFFDFIHGRNIGSGVSNWDHLLSEMICCVNPRGYVELCEYSITINCDDGTMKPDNGMKLYMDSLRESMTKMVRPPPNVGYLTQLPQKAGFEEIYSSEVKEPVGPWPKDPRQKRIGAMVLLNCETGLESYGMAAFTGVLGMEDEKARDMCDAAHYHIYRVYGRKPTGAGAAGSGFCLPFGAMAGCYWL